MWGILTDFVPALAKLLIDLFALGIIGGLAIVVIKGIKYIVGEAFDIGKTKVGDK